MMKHNEGVSEDLSTNPGAGIHAVSHKGQKRMVDHLECWLSAAFYFIGDLSKLWEEAPGKH
jgi:hypothetical protein